MRRVAWKTPMFFEREETRLSRLPLAASLESEEDSSIQSVVAVPEPPPEEEEEEEVRPPLLEWIGRRGGDGYG